MLIHPCPSVGIRVVGFLALFLTIALVYLTPVQAQVVIRERVEIVPRHDARAEATSSTLSTVSSTTSPAIDYLIGSGIDRVRAIKRGVRVSVSVEFTPPPGTQSAAVEVFVTIGGTSYLLLAWNQGLCTVGGGAVAPPTDVVLNCDGTVALSARGWRREFGACLASTFYGRKASEISGDKATLRILGNSGAGQFEVILTVSASVNAEEQVTEVAVTPSREALQCSGSATVEVRPSNGRGEAYTPCRGQTYRVTAALQGAGDYAYLRSGSQQGSMISYRSSSWLSSFEVVLDTARGIIPGGFVGAEILVAVEEGSGSSPITLRCSYPVPTVRITHPSQDTLIVLTATHQPVLLFAEEHTPTEGKWKPMIAWTPGPALDTREYYEQMQPGDTVVVPVTVVARNAAGLTAGDGRVVRLVKKGCEGPPCEGSTASPSISISEVGREYPKLEGDPCATDEGQRSGGVFRPLRESEEPVSEFSPEVCFDAAANVWKFSVGSLNLRVLVATCREALEARRFKVIESVDQIPDAEACDARLDILGHYNHPPSARPEGYILHPVLLAHERVHRKQFERKLSEARDEGTFDKELGELTVPCEETSSLEDARARGKRRIERLLGDLVKLASSYMADERRRMGNDQFEQMTQEDETIKMLIREAYDKLDSRCQF
jgi:hypothetical protein